MHQSPKPWANYYPVYLIILYSLTTLIATSCFIYILLNLHCVLLILIKEQNFTKINCLLRWAAEFLLSSPAATCARKGGWRRNHQALMPPAEGLNCSHATSTLLVCSACILKKTAWCAYFHSFLDCSALEFIAQRACMHHSHAKEAFTLWHSLICL